MNLKLILREELERGFKDDVLKFFTDELNIKSKVLLDQGESSVKSEKKVADIFFPKAGVFTLKINDKDSFQFVRELAHELVHVKQIEDKKLKLINPSMVEYEGKTYDISNYTENFKDDDNDTPFDKAANREDKVLANKYWNHKNLKESFDKNINSGILNKSISTHNVEMVRLSALEFVVGEDRTKKPIMMNGENFSEKNISKLMIDIKTNGFKEPLLFVYDPQRGEGAIIEGNHRYEAAKRMGLEYVPVQCEVMTLRSEYSRQQNGMFPLSTSDFEKGLNPKHLWELGYPFKYNTRSIKSSDYINDEQIKPEQRSFFNNVDIKKGDFKN